MIEYEKRAMIEAEDKYTFRQSTQISMQTGLIGHLRADMDTDGRMNRATMASVWTPKNMPIFCA